MNTILDDIASVIGFSATLKLVAWFGDGIANLYVPAVAEEGQLLPRIIGLPAARQLSKEWPKKHLNVPRLHNYEVELRKRHIARMVDRGYSVREIAGQLQMSERRVSQVKEELRSSGLLVEPSAAAASAAESTESTMAPPPAATSHVDSMVRGSITKPGSTPSSKVVSIGKRETIRLQGRKRN